MRKLCICFVLIVVFLLGCSSNEKDTEVELVISAATSLQDALAPIQKMYEEENTNVKLTFNFGSSGTLQKQILQGAPVDLFFSAAKNQFEELVEKGEIHDTESVDLLKNKLVLITPKDSQFKIKDFESLKQLDTARISIGTPETVPAGFYAKETLTNLGLWEVLEGKIVFAKDVRQVLSYVETKNVEVGIVYATDARNSEKVNIIATASKSLHTPIIYPVGILKDSKEHVAAKDFLTFLQSEEALKQFEKYGFTIE
ncbi:molybdate transport system substrate-binding protein [Ureibacillus xyleni]|uniref:Molybdate transport system substrate-binding protein n=1 Tax=Ureibacillus xyleni TaxID=614648 RepID=A0A285RYX7_9BACL|nr:molybdate transport system substrate-binding protein [Ureibacillus xyleni]